MLVELFCWGGKERRVGKKKKEGGIDFNFFFVAFQETLNLDRFVMKMEGRENQNTEYQLCGVLVV